MFRFPVMCRVEWEWSYKAGREMNDQNDPFRKFVEVIAALRHPQTGCPWDLEQTHQTLRPYLVEETYEVLEAIDLGDDREFRDELGDLLLQVVLHSRLAEERKAFAIDDVIRAVSEKMIRRHPHVFGTTQVDSSDEVLKNWEAIKSQERAGKSQGKHVSVLDGIPQALPALIRAQRIGEKAARVGFDWQRIADVREKIEEELGELDAEAQKADEPDCAQTTAPKERPAELQRALESEIGDLLFSICQYARWLGISAEDSLRGTIERFTARFHDMEKNSREPLKQLNPQELDQLWEKAKQRLAEEGCKTAS
jgi:tetrapyrrole methylase family protein/MazG family protein